MQVLLPPPLPPSLPLLPIWCLCSVWSGIFFLLPRLSVTTYSLSVLHSVVTSLVKPFPRPPHSSWNVLPCLEGLRLSLHQAQSPGKAEPL